MSPKTLICPFPKSVVRIYSNSGGVIGAGFLVIENYILTCAHVVASALGIKATIAEMPATEVSLEIAEFTNQKGSVWGISFSSDGQFYFLSFSPAWKLDIA